MTPSEQAVLTFVIVISLFGGGFVLWGAWCAFWGIYDHFMQQYTRQRNTQFDARVGRDCYRDIKGIHR